ncbi:VRR-NUC domain-containing protein [Phycicoccus endophyticus]|uniref:VRR-NUC domain-containing protein n=2 Tax=Phycicoccus endophyticus TaxID=1690220 RepID=A0A7G9R5M1_9MICO|nr:VRR-NUC domain-containing protein [Phycicoccus endophyticus]QNN50896.1 VRR-NUC domain-containing protein [Phycicoccus endophyticus]
MAQTLRCLTYHTHDSRRSNPGSPDLVIAGRRGVLYRELKTATGRLSRAQDEWLSTLVLAGANAAVWRPEDWPVRIHREIRAVS